MSEQWLQDMRMKYPSRGGYHPNNWLKVIGIEELQKEREKEQGKSGGTESFKEFAATFPTKHPKPTPDPVIKFRKLYEPPVEIKLDYDKKGKPKITRGVLSDNLQRVAEREKNRKIQEKREREQAIRLSDARIKAFEEKTNKRRLAEQKKKTILYASRKRMKYIKRSKRHMLSRLDYDVKNWLQTNNKKKIVNYKKGLEEKKKHASLTKDLKSMTSDDKLSYKKKKTLNDSVKKS